MATLPVFSALCSALNCSVSPAHSPGSTTRPSPSYSRSLMPTECASSPNNHHQRTQCWTSSSSNSSSRRLIRGSTTPADIERIYSSSIREFGFVRRNSHKILANAYEFAKYTYAKWNIEAATNKKASYGSPEEVLAEQIESSEEGAGVLLDSNGRTGVEAAGADAASAYGPRAGSGYDGYKEFDNRRWIDTDNEVGSEKESVGGFYEDWRTREIEKPNLQSEAGDYWGGEETRGGKNDRASPSTGIEGSTEDMDKENIERFRLRNDREVFEERAYVVGIDRKGAGGRSLFGIKDSLDELTQLADTAGLAVVGSTYQKLGTNNPKTYIGGGKVAELKAAIHAFKAETVIFDDELSPGQARNLEKAFGDDVRVCDRTALILDIFSQRAATREASLQVELAQFEYQLPRLTKMWTHLERQAGGMVKGMGEKQIEVDKRILQTRAGYTNAGKSTFLNRLSGADVLAKDRLFATLDPTTRHVELPNGKECLFTDTLGFIQKLPTQLVSTGDVMGDIHGANLIKEILKKAQESHQTVKVYALGGQRMKDAGATLIGDNTGLSSIGLLEALPLIVPSLQLQSAVRSFLEEHPPDVVVLLDYPGVNIPFGQYVKQKFGCKVFYYIPPNEWLWNKSRSGRIVTFSDTILAVYPGEADYYTSIGGNVELVGHPLIDAFKSITREDARCTLGIPERDLVVALLPASRVQELRHVWPTVASAAGKLLKALIERRGDALGVHFIIPAVLSDQRHLIERGCQDNAFAENSLIWNGDSHIVMAAADVAITKSGSVNLELALYNVPQVVVYKIDAATAWIARKVFQFSVEHISLVNLILNLQLVPEFIQEAADVDMIAQATLELLPNMDTSKRREVLEGYQQLQALLGKPGVVSRAAQKILAAQQVIC